MVPTLLTSPSGSGSSDILKPEPRIDVVQSLRGIAALGVAWFHFTNGNGKFLPVGILKSSGSYGWLGVDIFFVISGFVLPYSLFRARYRPSAVNYGRFLWKRVSRLDPPYLASIVLVVGLGYLSAILPGYRGLPPMFSWKPILLHLGYLNAFFRAPWLNIVYWSLAIEFQYYLLIGLLFPLIRSENRAVRLIFLGALGLSPMIIPMTPWSSTTSFSSLWDSPLSCLALPSFRGGKLLPFWGSLCWARWRRSVRQARW
jgi:peptidoglycan/LPS O-acetylase OafA/YrhL